MNPISISDTLSNCNPERRPSFEGARKLLFGVAALLSLWAGTTACDIVDPKDARKIVPKDTITINKPSGADTTVINGETVVFSFNPKKNVLLDDFTGHQCGNCPEGNKQAHFLDSLYEGRLVSISVHTGWFARTGPGFPTNFSTAGGDQLASDFGIGASLPSGMVDRRPHSSDNSAPINYTAWAGAIQESLKDSVLFATVLKGSYVTDTNTRRLSVNAYLKCHIADSNSYKIVAYLTEDSITAEQLDYSISAVIPKYLHRNVLRTTLLPAEGAALNTKPVHKGNTFKRSFSYTLPKNWVASRCRLTAVILKAADASQAERQSVAQTDWVYLKNLSQ